MTSIHVSTNASKQRWRLDPRVKLSLVFLNGLAAFVLFNRTTGPILMAFTVFYALALGLWRPAMGHGLLFIALYVALYSDYAFLHVVAGFLGYLLRFFPLLLASSVLYKTTPVPLLVASLRKMKLPAQLLTPLCVIFRFFPSIKQDVIYITQSMRTRSIGLTPIRVLMHPMRSYEFIAVPILMRILTTAEELSASSETRGLGYPCKKTSLYSVKMKLPDFAVLAVFAAFFTTLIILF